jgi:hypothetical protein
VTGRVGSSPGKLIPILFRPDVDAEIEQDHVQAQESLGEYDQGASEDLEPQQEDHLEEFSRHRPHDELPNPSSSQHEPPDQHDHPTNPPSQGLGIPQDHSESLTPAGSRDAMDAMTPISSKALVAEFERVHSTVLCPM